jgi:hypothetical protein
MLIQSAVIVVDGVPVSGAVGMNVGDLVMVRAGLMDMTASKAVVIGARSFGCSVRGGNERRLKRERSHSRHHDDSSKSSAE